MTNGNTRSLLIKEAGMDRSSTPPYYIVDDDFQSPTDSSEDSIDVVRVPRSPVRVTSSTSSTSSTTTKRKYPADTGSKEQQHDSIKCGPLKKRLCARTVEQHAPFRPWNDTPKKTNLNVPSVQRIVSTTCPRIVPTQILQTDVPLSLVSKPSQSVSPEDYSSRSSSPLNLSISAAPPIISPIPIHRLAPYLPPSQYSPIMPIPLVVTPKPAYFRPPSPIAQPVPLIKKPIPTKIEPLRVPVHPTPNIKTEEAELILAHCEKQFPNLVPSRNNASAKNVKLEPLDTSKFKSPCYDVKSPTNSSCSSSSSGMSKKEQQRNYKNMTRERRIEANARERTRVHTISAAFEALRQAVPAYSDTQKLSKLAVLRIACSYITTLSNLLEDSPDLAESVEAMTRMLEKEGNVKRKKEADVDIDEDW